MKKPKAQAAATATTPEPPPADAPPARVSEQASAVVENNHSTGDAWDRIPPGMRFGHQLTESAHLHLRSGTLLRFWSSDPWFNHGDNMPALGEIVAFTGVVNTNDAGPHLEVARLTGGVFSGGGWVYRLFQFVSDPLPARGEPVAHLRDAHEGEGDECLVPAAEGDPGSFPVYR